MQNFKTDYITLLTQEIQTLNSKGHFFTATYDFKQSGPPNAARHICILTISYAGEFVKKFEGGDSPKYLCSNNRDAKNHACRYAYDAIKNQASKLWISTIPIRNKHAPAMAHSKPQPQPQPYSQSQSQFQYKKKKPTNQMESNQTPPVYDPSPYFDPQFYKSPVEISIDNRTGSISVYIDKTHGEEMTGKAIGQSLSTGNQICYYPDDKFGLKSPKNPTLNSYDISDVSNMTIVMYKYDTDPDFISKLKKNGNDVFVHITGKIPNGLIQIADVIRK